MKQAKPSISSQVQNSQEWLALVPKMRLLTIANEQDEQDLHQKSADVRVFGPELQQFCQALIQHMHDERGIGLAAPQMGVFQRIFVSQTDEEGEPLIVINPEIAPASEGKEVGEEGCLSVPGIYADVARWPAIDITAKDPFGKSFTLYLEGIDAICFQHENDHLEGILFTDYLSRSQLKKIKKLLAEQSAQASS